MGLSGKKLFSNICALYGVYGKYAGWKHLLGYKTDSHTDIVKHTKLILWVVGNTNHNKLKMKVEQYWSLGLSRVQVSWLEHPE